MMLWVWKCPSGRLHMVFTRDVAWEVSRAYSSLTGASLRRCELAARPQNTPLQHPARHSNGTRTAAERDRTRVATKIAQHIVRSQPDLTAHRPRMTMKDIYHIALLSVPTHASCSGDDLVFMFFYLYSASRFDNL